MKKERKRRYTSALALVLAAAILAGDPVSALAYSPPGAAQVEMQESTAGAEKGTENSLAAEEENRKEPSGSAAEGAQGSSAAGDDQAKEPSEPGESGEPTEPTAPTEPETPSEPTAPTEPAAPTEPEESEEPEESGEAEPEEAEPSEPEGDAEKEENADKAQAPMLMAEGEQQTEKFIISTDNEGAKKEIEPIESVATSTTYYEGRADYKENRIYIRYQFDGDQSVTTRKLSVNLEGGFQITSSTAVSSGIIDSVTVSQDKETMELVLSPALEQREGQVVLFNFSIQIPDREYAREKELAGYMVGKGGIYDGIKVTEYCDGTAVSSSSSALNVSYSQWSDHDVLNTQKDSDVWYPGIDFREAMYGYRPSWRSSDPTISDWFYGGMALITDAETVESKAEEGNPGQWQKKEGVYYVSTKNGHLLTRYAEEIEIEVPLPNGVEFVSANEVKNGENGTTVEKVEGKTGYIKVTQKAKAGEALGDKPIELWMTLDYTGVPDDSLDQTRGIEKYGVQGWHNFFANAGDGWTNGPAGREETGRPWSIRAKIFGAWKEEISFYDRSALVTTTQSRAAASRSYTYMEDTQQYYDIYDRDRDTYYLWGYEAVSPSNTSLSKLQAKTIWDFPDTIQLVSISGGTSSITNAYTDNEGNSYTSISSIPSGNWVKTMDKNRASRVTFSMKAKHSDGTEVSDGTVSSVKVTTEVEGYGLLHPKTENNGIQATYKKPQINSTTTYLDSGVHAFGKISYRSTESNGLYKYPVNATLDVPTSDYSVLTVYSGNTYTTRSTNTSTGTIQEKIYRGYEMENVTATLSGKSETGEESVFWDIFAQATGGQELESYFYVQFGTELPEEKKEIPKDAYLVCDIINKEGKKRTEEIRIAGEPETSGNAVKLPLGAIAMGAGEWFDSITLCVPRLAESTMISWHLNSIELSTQKELPKGGEMTDYMDILTEGNLTNVRRKGSPTGSAYAKYEWIQSDESGSKESIQKSQKVSSTSVFGVNWWTPMGDFSRSASLLSPSSTTPDEKIKMQVSIGGNGVNPTYVFEIAPEFYYEPESFEVTSLTRMDDLSEKDYRIRERWLPGKGTDGNHLLIISFEGESADTALNLYPITSTAVGGVNDGIATALLTAEITLNCDPLLEEGEYEPIKDIYRFDEWAENYLIDNNHATLDVSESSPVYCYWYRGEGTSVNRHEHEETKLKKTRLYMESSDLPSSVYRKQDTNDLDQDGDTNDTYLSYSSSSNVGGKVTINKPSTTQIRSYVRDLETGETSRTPELYQGEEFEFLQIMTIIGRDDYQDFAGYYHIPKDGHHVNYQEETGGETKKYESEYDLDLTSFLDIKVDDGPVPGAYNLEVAYFVSRDLSDLNDGHTNFEYLSDPNNQSGKDPIGKIDQSGTVVQAGYMTQMEIESAVGNNPDMIAQILKNVTTIRIRSNSFDVNKTIVGRCNMKVAELEEENMDENKDGKIFDYFSGIYTMKANSMSIGDIYVPLMTLNIMKHTISGQIWMDKNANSRKDDTAAGISNISVSLLQKDPNTGEYKPAEDESGMPIKDTTDSEGNYELSRWMHGDYRVQFEIPKGTQYLSTLDAYGDGYSGSSSMFEYMGNRKNGDLTVYADCVFKNNDPQMDGMNAGLIDERGVEAPEEITIYKGYDSDLTYTLTPDYLKDLSDEGGLTVTPGAGSNTYFTWDSATKKVTGVAEGTGTLTLTVPQPKEVSDYTGKAEAKDEVKVKVVDITPDAVVTIPATVVLTDGNVGDTGVDKDAYAGADVTVRMVEGYDSRTVKVQLEDGLAVTEQGGKESLSVRYYVGKDWKNENTGSKGLIDIATIGKDHDAEADVHFITDRGRGKKTYEGTANWQLSFAEGGNQTAAVSGR